MALKITPLIKKYLSETPAIYLLFLFGITLSACTAQIKPEPVVIKQDASLDELVSRYQEGQKQHRSLKALMKVDADLGERGHHSFQAIWRLKTQETHIRGLSLFGGTLFDLKVDDDSFSLKLPSQKQDLEGDLDYFESVVGKQIHFGSLDLLKWVGRGGLPDLSFPRLTLLEKGPDLFLLTVFSLNKGSAILQEKIWIERAAFHVVRVELFNPEGYRRAVIELSDYQSLEGRSFPFSVTGKVGQKVLKLTFREVSFP